MRRRCPPRSRARGARPANPQRHVARRVAARYLVGQGRRRCRSGAHEPPCSDGRRRRPHASCARHGGCGRSGGRRRRLQRRRTTAGAAAAPTSPEQEQARPVAANGGCDREEGLAGPRLFLQRPRGVAGHLGARPQTAGGCPRELGQGSSEGPALPAARSRPARRRWRMMSWRMRGGPPEGACSRLSMRPAPDAHVSVLRRANFDAARWTRGTFRFARRNLTVHPTMAERGASRVARCAAARRRKVRVLRRTPPSSRRQGTLSMPRPRSGDRGRAGRRW
mmetsp:Transcript_106030/g.296782  ORF Transcript_106030/g.296782 Transcript_106030/m.296782 type:complete len:279 (+) Transcript_106030:347-1183(+)